MTYIDIVFQGPPSAPATFVEVENPSGASISVGEWIQRPDGYWVLRIPQPSPVVSADIAAWLLRDHGSELSPLGRDYTDAEIADALTAVAAERDAAIREMHARELHHFEEEQISANLRADRDRLHKAITEALAELGDPEGKGPWLSGNIPNTVRRILRAALDKEGNDDE